ncbi:MAG: hypothetical protein GY943_17610 [Chloroflexi bacterium]|nr:hypothetical protein [Chloroflexota bacterium]
MLADGLATAVAVLGSQTGFALINQLSHIEAYLVTKKMQVMETEGFSQA